MTPEQRLKLKEIRQRNQALIREANQQKLPGNVVRQRQQACNATQTCQRCDLNQRKLHDRRRSVTRRLNKTCKPALERWAGFFVRFGRYSPP